MFLFSLSEALTLQDMYVSTLIILNYSSIYTFLDT